MQHSFFFILYLNLILLHSWHRLCFHHIFCGDLPFFWQLYPEKINDLFISIGLDALVWIPINHNLNNTCIDNSKSCNCFRYKRKQFFQAWHNPPPPPWGIPVAANFETLKALVLRVCILSLVKLGPRTFRRYVENMNFDTFLPLQGL